jgi:ribosomal protein L24
MYKLPLEKSISFNRIVKGATVKVIFGNLKDRTGTVTEVDNEYAYVRLDYNSNVVSRFMLKELQML